MDSHSTHARSSLVCALYQQSLRCMGHLAVCGHLTSFAALQG